MSTSRSAELFAVFNQLAELNAEKRVVACKKLLKETENGNEELSYSLKRLIRGLSSSRAAARQGFALGLSALLRNGRVEDVAKVLDELELDTKTSKKERGEEEREKLIGRGFGYLALIRSGGLDKDATVRIARGLASLSQEKAWLHELCANAMCALINNADKELFHEIEAELEPFFKTSAEDTASRDPEQIAVLIALERAKGEDAHDLLKEENLKNLSKPLAAAWRATPPRLHLVWEQICPACAELGLGKELWSNVVEPALLRGGLVSPERKCAGFMVFGRLVDDLARCNRPEEIPQYMLTRSTLGSFLSHAKSTTKALNEPARAALRSLVIALSRTSEDQSESFDKARQHTLKELLKFGDFDAKSGTDTMHSIAARLSEPFAEEQFEFLKAQMVHPWAVNAFVDLGRAFQGKPLEKKVLMVLFEKGFFEELDEATGEVKKDEQATALAEKKKKQKKSKKQSSSDDDDDAEAKDDGDSDDEDEEDKRVDVRLVCRQRFFTVLTRLSKSEDDFIALLKELHANWESKVSKAGKRKNASARFRTIREETEESRASLTACREAAQWLSGAEVGEANAKIVRAFEALVLLVGLLLLVPEDAGSENNEEEAEFLKIDVADLVEDLKEASKRIVSSLVTGKKPSKSKKKTEEDDDPVAVTVDVMLALLAQPSTLIRDMVANLSKSLAMNIADSKPALETLLEVLTKPHKVMIKAGGEEDEEEDEVEMEPSESENEGEDEDGDDNEAPPEKSKGEAKFATADEAEDDEEGSEEEENPEQAMKEMHAYDRALGEYLKQRKLSTQKVKENALVDAEKEAITFKLRVLDVLEAIVNRASENRNLRFQLPLSLLNAAEMAVPGKKETSKKQLQGPSAALFARLMSVQRKYFRSKQLPQSFDSFKDFEAVFHGVLDFLSSKAKHKELAKLTMETIGFLVRVGRKNSDVADKLRRNLLEEALSPIIKAIFTGHSNSTFVDSKSLLELVDKFPDLSWSLLKTMCEITPRTPFQRAQQMQVLSRMLRLRKDSIPSEDASLLRKFVLQSLTKEEEDLAKGKIKADKLRTCLRFVQQVQSVAGGAGTKEGEEFSRDMEPIFVRLIQNSNSPAVKQMLMAMSSPASKQVLEAAHEAKKAAAAVDLQQKQSKKRAASEDANGEDATGETPNKKNKKAKQASKFFEGVGDGEDDNSEGEGDSPDEEEAKDKKQSSKKKDKSRKRTSSGGMSNGSHGDDEQHSNKKHKKSDAKKHKSKDE